MSVWDEAQKLESAEGSVWDKALALEERPAEVQDPNEAYERAGKIWDTSVDRELPISDLEQDWDLYTIPKIVDPATSGMGTGDGRPYPLAKTLFVRPYLAMMEAAIPGARRALLSLTDAHIPKPEFTALVDWQMK